MESIITNSYPRAAVIGNPSDGYYGKTIAFVFGNYRAEVKLTPSQGIKITPGENDLNHFEDIDHLMGSIEQRGYYGGVRLLKASIKKFYEYVSSNGWLIEQKGFELSYSSNIPIRLGMAGSSAIVTAAVKAMMVYFEVKIEKPQLAGLILSVEKEELGISAGLQDRVAQVYESPVYMSFDRDLIEGRGFGTYIPFSAELLTNLYIAFSKESSEGSEVVHNDLRQRFDNGDRKVIRAMESFADYTDQTYQFINRNEFESVDVLINANFDLRRSICQVADNQERVIQVARSCGASAKFTGSGGAIIGRYKNEEMYQLLERKFQSEHIQVIKPIIIDNVSH